MTGNNYGRELVAVAAAFVRMGLIAFGGPAAHLALLEDEFVSRRGWVTRQRFLDLMGATNLIPGPNSTEMTMHLGYERAGAPGLFAAGLGFVLPAAGSTAFLAWLYVAFGTLPDAEAILAGIRPAALAVVAGAVAKLGRKALANWRLGLIGAGVLVAQSFGVGELTALVFGSVLGALWLRLPRFGAPPAALGLLLALPAGALAAPGPAVPLGKLGLFFAKVGAVLYGSGYVLVAFLEGGLVEDYGWLTQEQLLDAIAVGQFTPGPVLTAATFVGFVLAGPAGAAVATGAIFLPAFGFVWALNPLVRRLRQAEATAALLDAVNAAAVGLMAAVALDLAQSILGAPVPTALAALAGAALFLARWPAARVIVGCGLLGWILAAAGWR